MKKMYFLGKSVGKFGVLLTIVSLFFMSGGLKAQDIILFDGESLETDFSQWNSIELDATEWSPNSNVEASVKIDNGEWNSGNFWDNTDNMVFENVDLVNGAFTIDYKTTEVTHIKGIRIQDWSNGCSKVATVLEDGGHDYTGLIADGEWHTLTIQFNETWSQDYIDCFSPADQINPRIVLQIGTGGVIWFDHAIYHAVAPTYTLTVENGTGGGDYQDAEEVTIEADAPAAGQMFDQWTGDIDNVDDVTASTATVTMSTEAATITATYVDIPTYTLTVENGTGGGDYEEGAEVTIAATVPDGSTFSSWTGDVANVADVNAAETTLTMPAQAITVTADIVTGINQVDLGEGITVLPNPVKDGSLRINSDVVVKDITVVSLAGVEVLQEANVGSKKVNLNVSGLASGQYLVRIVTSDGDIVVKSFVKQ